MFYEVVYCRPRIRYILFITHLKFLALVELSFVLVRLQILLRSDKRQAASNFGDRQLLKNLGLWLGTITIARDRPIVTSVSGIVFPFNNRSKA